MQSAHVGGRGAEPPDGGELAWFHGEVVRAVMRPREFAGALAREHFGLAGVVVALVAGMALSLTIDVFVLGPDSAIYRRSWNGSAWTSWQSLGGSWTSHPTSISRAGRIDIFDRGTDSAIWHLTLS